MNLLLVDDEIAMLHIMEKAIDWKKKGIQKVFTAYNTDLARDIISSSKTVSYTHLTLPTNSLV